MRKVVTHCPAAPDSSLQSGYRIGYPTDRKLYTEKVKLRILKGFDSPEVRQTVRQRFENCIFRKSDYCTSYLNENSGLILPLPVNEKMMQYAGVRDVVV